MFIHKAFKNGATGRNATKGRGESEMVYGVVGGAGGGGGVMWKIRQFYPAFLLFTYGREDQGGPVLYMQWTTIYN